MVESSNYGLIHPSSEAVSAAYHLWNLFGEEPAFRALLDRLYAESTDLLEFAHPYVFPVSSLQAATAQWLGIQSRAEETHQAASLGRQMKQIQEGVWGQGLRCEWACYSILYTLHGVFAPNISRRIDRRLAQRLDTPPPKNLNYIPILWAGTSTLVDSGLMDPNSSGYVGKWVFETGGDSWFQKADAEPVISFQAGRPENYTVSAGISPEKYKGRFEQGQAYFMGRGMAKPKRREDFLQTIDWLFLGLTTGLS